MPDFFQPVKNLWFAIVTEQEPWLLVRINNCLRSKIPPLLVARQYRLARHWLAVETTTKKMERTMSESLSKEEIEEEKHRLSFEMGAVPVPLSETPKHNWRHPPVLTFGETLLNEIDPERNILSVEQHEEILTIQNVESLRAMVYADLSRPLKPDIATAERVFGALMMRQIEIPQVILTWRFYALVQCQMCIDDMTKQMADPSLTNEEKINAGRARVEALREMKMMLDRVTTLAKTIGALKILRDRSKKGVIKKTPKNAAPNLDG